MPLFEQAVASDVASELLGREAFTGATYLHYQEAAAWMRGEQAHADFEERLRRDLLDLARVLRWDMISPPWRHSARPAAQLDEYNFLYGDPDGDHYVARFDPQAKTFQVAARRTRAHAPAMPDDLAPAVEALAEQAAGFGIEDAAAAFPWQAQMLREHGEEFEVTGGVGMGIPLDEVWLAACLERPDLVARYLDAQLAMNLKSLEAQAALGLYVMWGGGDLAGRGGPFYGPRIFRELMLPRIRRLTDRCHELGLVYVFRTDGNVRAIERELLFESGIDGYGEIDYEAGMDLAHLKPRYGGRVTFWGNVPCGTILHHGTPAQVAEFTRRMLEAAAPGGGLIAGSSNTVMPGTPARNVEAMVQAVLRHGRYGS